MYQIRVYFGNNPMKILCWILDLFFIFLLAFFFLLFVLFQDKYFIISTIFEFPFMWTEKSFTTFGFESKYFSNTPVLLNWRRWFLNNPLIFGTMNTASSIFTHWDFSLFGYLTFILIASMKIFLDCAITK